MLNTYQLNENWLFRNRSEESEFGNTGISLPFIHGIEDMPPCSFSSEWTAGAEDEGKTAYVCFSRISGKTVIKTEDEEKADVPGITACLPVLLTDNALPGKKYKVEAEISPYGRNDGKFVFGGVKVITVSSSHFSLENEGIPYVRSILKDGCAEIHIKADIVKPNNYDVVSFTVLDPSGEKAAVKTAKPTAAETVIKIENPVLWDGQNDASLYTLEAVLQRDSAVLDETDMKFGIKDIRLSDDGFLYLSGIRLPLCGVKLTDCSAVKSDLNNFKLLDGNCIASSDLPSKTDILSLSDEKGNFFCYAPGLKDDDDRLRLKEFLLKNRSHPSFIFALCPGTDDKAYRDSFVSAVKEYAPDVFTAVTADINHTEDFDPGEADIISVNIPFTARNENFIGISARFEELKERFPGKFFAINAASPLSNEAGEEETARWHVKMWENFRSSRRVIAYIADTFTDERRENGRRGLISSDRKNLTGSFWFYKAQFSAGGFIKICPDDTSDTAEKTADVRCFTNLGCLRILVNGKDRKLKAEKLSEGVYIYRGIKLKRGENLIEVSAGNECDSAVISRF